MNIELNNVRVKIRKLGIVQDCSLHLPAGSFTAIIGPCGSGKSTMLKVISGLLRPDSGHVLYDGISQKQMNSRHLEKMRLFRMGWISQNIHLLEGLSVKENILLVSRARRQPCDSNYYEYLLEKLNLKSMEYNKAGKLSMGEQQRVMVARALLMKPDVILADEPASALDTRMTDRILQLLKESQLIMGQTVLVVTHDLNLAKQADRLFYMEDGMLRSYEP